MLTLQERKRTDFVLEGLHGGPPKVQDEVLKVWDNVPGSVGLKEAREISTSSNKEHQAVVLNTNADVKTHLDNVKSEWQTMPKMRNAKIAKKQKLKSKVQK